ncbi:lysoplasmalogenase [Thalassotalea sp. LPB0316]|uniref:lysoplasmalogenase n=1 Tax=Thalassotalea sp. LPB0316 TaxID=2769490 RepID=UPI0018669DA6|nr:lysoplasmalogenase [Thalassotalea sp. LPB0316]QOL24516.1 lysoplasmalogenase [Thalassotalea sp. LPB0316]
MNKLQSPPITASGVEHRIRLLFIITATIYLLSLPFTPYPYQFSVKALPIFLLALTCFQLLTGKSKWFMSLALLASLIGDICLALSFPLSFQYGLVAFLSAHIFYSVYFISLKSSPSDYRLFAVFAVVVFSLIAGSQILPHTSSLLVPVLIYLIVISCMAIIALYKQINNQLTFGVFCFLVSDTLLALNLFVSPIPLASLWVMLTYYSAQYFIVSGIFRYHQRQVQSE